MRLFTGTCCLLAWASTSVDQVDCQAIQVPNVQVDPQPPPAPVQPGQQGVPQQHIPQQPAQPPQAQPAHVQPSGQGQEAQRVPPPEQHQQNVPVIQVNAQPAPVQQVPQQGQAPNPQQVPVQQQQPPAQQQQYQYVQPAGQQQRQQAAQQPTAVNTDQIAAAIQQAQQIIAQQQQSQQAAAAAAAIAQQQQKAYSQAAQQFVQGGGQIYYGGQHAQGQPLKAVPGAAPTYTYVAPGGQVFDVPVGYEVKHVPYVPGQYNAPNVANQQVKAKSQPAGFDLPNEEYRMLHAPEGKHNAAAEQAPAASAHDNSTETLAAEWERIMTDFLPDMIVTFKLPGASQEHFQQDVGPEPVLLRGGFFESTDDSMSSIAFQIVSPSGKVAYKSTKGEGLFRIMTAEEGTYTFAVSNTGWTGHKYVTFVVGAGIEKQLTTEDVETLDGSIRHLYRILSDVETQNSYLWLRQKNRMEENQRTANQTYYAFILQLIATGIATLFQLKVIKGMVSHRRMF